MKTKNLILLFFIVFLSLNVFSASLTNQITEPANQPIFAGSTFTLENRTLVDQNFVSSSQLINGGGFETIIDQNSNVIHFEGFNSLCKNSGASGTKCAHTSTNDITDISNVCNNGAPFAGTVSQLTSWFTEGSKSVMSGGDQAGVDLQGTIACVAMFHKNNSIEPLSITFNKSQTVLVLNHSTDLVEGVFLNNKADIIIDSNYSFLFIALGAWTGTQTNWFNGQILTLMSETDFNAYTNQTLRFFFDVNTTENGAAGSSDWNGRIDNIRVATITTLQTFPHADCNSSFNNQSFNPMTFNPDSNSFSINFTAPNFSGDYNYAISCSYVTDFNSSITVRDYDEGLISVKVPEFAFLTVTPIENIASFEFGSVIFNPSNELNDLIWRVDSNSNLSQDVNYVINNSLTDGRQYFIYTATQTQYDANQWVFNDSLTFGTTNNNPIQKIWNEGSNRYNHQFTDTLTPLQTKFYKLTYDAPYKHYFSIFNSSEWYTGLAPRTIDTNGIDYDEYSISTFSNIRDVFIQNVPDIFVDQTQAFEFQFTAWTDGNSVSLLSGTTIDLFNSDSTQTVTATLTPHRFSIAIDANNFNSQLLLKTTNTTSANVYITDYALIPRAYFTKRLELRKSNGDFLDLILISNESTPYLQEGKEFRLSTEAYDTHGNLQELVVKAFLDSNSENNLVKSALFPEINPDSDEEFLLTFDELMPAIIDLNGNATNPNPPRNIIVQAHLFDDNGVEVAIQAQTVTFLQYPYFPSDISLEFFPLENKVGKKPKGQLLATISEPETLEGFEIRIYDNNSSFTNPDYQTIIYKDKDFTCILESCNFQITINDFLFERDQNIYAISIQALLNTETPDSTNTLTRIIRYILVVAIQFETAKIHQVVERSDLTYRADEQIPLVLILRDSEATSLKDKINVRLNIALCNAPTGGVCVAQTTDYAPTGYLYDPQNNYNYYFFRQIFINSAGGLLPDGNYVQVRTTVTDATGSRTQITPVLAYKCKDNLFDGNFFFAGALNSILTRLGTQCLTNEDQFALVTTTTNSAQEVRLLIDQDHVVSDPSQEFFMCLRPLNENTIQDEFEQNLSCFIWYTVGESSIDSFRYRITNPNSDLSDEGSTRQYVQFDLPYEIVAYSDLVLLKEELEKQQNTTIDTMGEFIFESFRTFARDYILVGGLETLEDFTNGTSIITNVGTDINFNQAFSPAFVGGGIFFRVNGFPIVNMQDYKFNSSVSQDFNVLNPLTFREYLAEKNIFIKKDSELELFTSTTALPFTLKDDVGVLIINEEPTDQTINTETLDENNLSDFATIPNILTFNIQTTMFWNNFTENSSLFIPFSVLTIIKESAVTGFIEFFQNLFTDPFGTLGLLLIGSIMFIVVAFGLIYVFSVIYKNFSNGGGNNGVR